MTAPIELTKEQWDEIMLGAAAAASGGSPRVNGQGAGSLGSGPSNTTEPYQGQIPGYDGGITGGYAYPGVQPAPSQAASGMLIGGGGNPIAPTSAMTNPGGGRGPLITGADQLIQDLTNMGVPIATNTPTVADPFQSSGLPINETLLANMIYDETQMAITLGGTAGYGTPGYWNLAGMDFDPYSVFLASGGNVLNGPTEYLQFASNMYNTMGTVGSQGGGTVNAGSLLKNMVMAPESSQLGMMFAEKPEMFYQMAVDVAGAAGMSPMGQQALKLQLAGLYQEYMTNALTSNAADVPAFHTWIAASHPEVVASWGA
jgi:hypothetical protein